jgi:RHS repeat-associated protein
LKSNTGRLLKITHPEGYTQDYIYSSTSGDLVAYRNIDGQVTEYDYDEFGRLETLTDPYGDDTMWTHYDDTQTSYTIGALQKVDRSNDTFDEYLYDSDGRLDQIQYKQGQTTLSYVDLTYDDAGMITGKNMGGTYNVDYDYDDAYRLTNEIYNNSSDVEQFRRTYSYDDAGNRATMAFDGKTTGYTYGSRNEMTSNTGFARFGSVDTGAQTFTYDDRGNMTYQSGITNTWNEDNRLTRVHISEGDPKGGNHAVYYDYDSAGRRIASHKNTGEYTRYFFNGLTEEVKKVSIGTHSNTSFGIVTKLDAEGSDGGVSGFNTLNVMSISNDTDRHSNVYACSDWASHGAGWWNTANDGWDISGKRTVSFWAKTTTTGCEVAIHVKCTDGTKLGLYYMPGTGTDYKHSSNPVAYFYQGNTSNDYLNSWGRIERDLQVDLSAFWPGKTLSKVTGLSVGTGSFDDIRFSNSMTVEHNVLGPGSISHILRNSTFNTTTHARTDSWFHYDQVGSVVARSDDAVTPALTNLYADAWGNRMSSYTTGEWTSTWASRDGWGHNTKEYDGDSGLVYMFQRWYQPELGIFLNQAPRADYIEHPYTFARQNPVSMVDLYGEEEEGFDWGPEDLTPDGSNISDCCGKEVKQALKKAWELLDSGIITDEAWEECIRERLNNTKVDCGECDNKDTPEGNIIGEGSRPAHGDTPLPEGKRGNSITWCNTGHYKDLSNLRFGEAFVHEAAHNCGWDHKNHDTHPGPTGIGVPHDPSFDGGTTN